MFKVIAIILLSLASQAHADTIGAHLATWHSKAGYQNINPGVYVVRDQTAVGVYANSEGGTSAYAGRVFETEDRAFSLTVGAVVGYRDRPVMPLVLPSALLFKHLRLTYIPKAEKKGTHALHFSVETEF